MHTAHLQDLLTARTPPKVIFGYFLSFILGCVGGFAGGYSGWLYDDGRITVMCAIGGFVLFFCCTFTFSGPGDFHYAKMLTSISPPSRKRLALTQLSSFDLFITVHSVKNVLNTDPILGFFGMRSQMYCEVSVGRLVDGGFFSVQQNKAKNTCVQKTGEFEECFRFTVAPTDDTIKIRLFDQDLLKDDEVGFVYINIVGQVLDLGFPQKKGFTLHSDTKYEEDIDRDPGFFAGQVILSFSPGENLPRWSATAIKTQSPFAFDHLQDQNAKLLKETDKTNYGTWTSAVV